MACVFLESGEDIEVGESHRDDVDPCVGADLCDRLAETADDAGVDVEEVVAGHARLARHSSRDDDEVAPLEGLLDTVLADKRAHFDASVDVGEVRAHTGGVDDVVEPARTLFQS